MSPLSEHRAASRPQTAQDFAARPEFAEVSRQARPTPPRYRNEIGKYSVHRTSACVACGKCAELCPEGVHLRPDGYGQRLAVMCLCCLEVSTIASTISVAPAAISCLALHRGVRAAMRPGLCPTWRPAVPPPEMTTDLWPIAASSGSFAGSGDSTAS